jgi:hypothetical protein
MMVCRVNVSKDRTSRRLMFQEAGKGLSAEVW